MWHASAGVALFTPSDWIDDWLNDPGRVHLVPWGPLVLALWLLAHRLRWRPQPLPAPAEAPPKAERSLHG
jgi:hypothetical protein